MMQSLVGALSTFYTANQLFVRLVIVRGSSETTIKFTTHRNKVTKADLAVVLQKVWIW